jgi:gas vesicle protein
MESGNGLSKYHFEVQLLHQATKEDDMEDRDKKIAAALLLIVAGGVIGAGLALLFAPQAGNKTRKDLVRYAKKARNRADEAVEELAANVNNMVDTIGEKADELVEKGKDVAGGARKDLIKLIEEGASKLEKFRTMLSRI